MKLKSGRKKGSQGRQLLINMASCFLAIVIAEMFSGSKLNLGVYGHGRQHRVYSRKGPDVKYKLDSNQQGRRLSLLTICHPLERYHGGKGLLKPFGSDEHLKSRRKQSHALDKEQNSHSDYKFFLSRKENGHRQVRLNGKNQGNKFNENATNAVTEKTETSKGGNQNENDLDDLSKWGAKGGSVTFWDVLSNASMFGSGKSSDDGKNREEEEEDGDEDAEGGEKKYLSIGPVLTPRWRRPRVSTETNRWTTNGQLDGNDEDTVTNTTSEIRHDEEMDASDSPVEDGIDLDNDKDEDEDYAHLYRPMRIRAVLTADSSSGGLFLTPLQRRTLMRDILYPAISAWSGALLVVPVEGNLTLDENQLADGVRCGPGVGTDDGNDGTFTNNENDFDWESEDTQEANFGELRSGSPVLPKDHLRFGVGETDLVVYISVGFGEEYDVEEDKASFADEDKEGVGSESAEYDAGGEFDGTTKERDDSLLMGSEAEEAWHLGQSSGDMNSFNSGGTLSSHDGLLNEQEDEEDSLLVQDVTALQHDDNGFVRTFVPSPPTREPTSSPSFSPSSSTDPPVAAMYDGSDEQEKPPERPKPKCALPDDPEILASSAFCNTDQYDRPVAGTIHFCLSNRKFFRKENLDRNVAVAQHELMHILGMNYLSLAHFRFSDGEPRTPRDENGDVPDVEVECAGPIHRSGDGTDGKVTSVMSLPSEETTLKFRETRTLKKKTGLMFGGGSFGNDIGANFGSEQVSDAVRVAEVITPTVAQVVRNQFNCQTLEGAELDVPYRMSKEETTVVTKGVSVENFVGNANVNGVGKRKGNFSHFPSMSPTRVPSARPTSAPMPIPNMLEGESPMFDGGNITVPPSLCIGSHWSKRLFYGDLMNPVVEDDAHPSRRISPLSLAYLLDSGWYRVNPLRISHVNEWGRGAGCDFVSSPCIDPGNPGDIPSKHNSFFCNEKLSPSEVHGCTSDLRGKAVCSLVNHAAIGEMIPGPFQYFSNSYGRHWGGTDADMEFCPYYQGFENGHCSDERNRRFVRFNEMEEFRPNSRCVMSKLARHDRTALCLPIACVISDQSLRVKVEGTWRKCNFAGQKLPLWWDDRDYVVCPDPWRTCPTFFCARNCLGTDNGSCDYETGKCLCEDKSRIPHRRSLAKDIETESVGSDSNATRKLCAHHVNTNRTSTWARSVEGIDSLEVSLLSYYVPRPEVLRNEPISIVKRTRRVFARMAGWQLFMFVLAAVLTIVTLGVVSFGVIRKIRMERSGEQNSATGLNEDQRREKYKFFAAMLVKLRLDERDHARRRGNADTFPPSGRRDEPRSRNKWALRKGGNRRASRFATIQLQRERADQMESHGNSLRRSPLFSDVVADRFSEGGDSSSTRVSTTLFGSTDSEASIPD